MLKPRPLTERQVRMLLTRLEASKSNWKGLAAEGPRETASLAAERVKTLENVEGWFEELFGGDKEQS